jgi:hypothetical protein
MAVHLAMGEGINGLDHLAILHWKWLLANVRRGYSVPFLPANVKLNGLYGGDTRGVKGLPCARPQIDPWRNLVGSVRATT